MADPWWQTGPAMTIDDSRSGAEQAACLVASYAPGTGLPAAMSYELLGRLAGEIAAAHGGQQVVRRTAGEVALVLPAVAGAVAAARALRAGGPGGSALGAMLRIAVHVGAPVRPGSPATSYDAPALRRCAHLSEIANPGQTVLSAAAAAAYSAATVAAGLPGELRDLGMHRLRDLGTAERVYALLSGPAARAPLRSLDTVPNNLPLQLTSFVGRYDERAAVRGLLTGNRLVTIAGPGGGGKTRLAAQVAAELADRWPDGVWWAELAAVTDPAQVSDAVAEAAGVLAELAGGQLRSLTAQLRDKRALVCLDNCEHVLDGAADVADALLRSCPEVTVLATSREPLDLPGEVVWRVPGLAEDDAVALFAERAGAVRAGFAVDEATEPVVRSLCGRLDGVPLALELAAAWLRTLTPAQIEAGLDDRFGLLVRGPRGAAERQRSLAASIDWSHELLDEPDRRVFARLAVFAGGFSLDAARAVCADGARRGTGCWRRSGSTPPRGWPPRARRRRSGTGTWRTSPDWRRRRRWSSRRTRTPGRRGSSRSGRTCGPRSTGGSPPRTRSPRGGSRLR